jgi:hypothetical protein
LTHSSGGLQLMDILWTLTPTKALHTLGNRPTRDQNYINVLALNGLGCKDLIAGMFELTKALNDE